MGVITTLEGSSSLSSTRKESSIWVLMRRQRARRRRALVKKKNKKKSLLEGSRRLLPCRGAIQRRVETLKELVPNTKTSSEGLDGLFRQTADYILALEMKVRVMQTMVQVLTENDCV